MPHSIRKFILTATAALAMCAVASGSASASVTVGGVSAGAVGDFSACRHQVEVTPWSFQSDNFDVYALVYVYDFAASRWTNAGWHLNDNITTQLVGAVNPYAYAYVYYARSVSGSWRVIGEWVETAPDLDSMFCARAAGRSSGHSTLNSSRTPVHHATTERSRRLRRHHRARPITPRNVPSSPPHVAPPALTR